MLRAASVKATAAANGFDLCGIARPDAAPRLQRLAAWLASGYAGDMAYLAKSLDERLDPHKVLPSVRSIVSVAVIYNTTQPYSTAATSEPGRAAIARYAWGDDYHEVLRSRLRALVQAMAAEAGRGFEAWSCVDNGPVQERVFAEQAGLGWIGKNTCLINPKLGSWLFLGEVFTNAELEADSAGVDQCGSCTRCLEACPTQAIIEPYSVDATRCLSYLTIERRHGVDEDLRPAIHDQIFGCDICQDVCPWNRRASTSDAESWQPREGLAFPRLIDLCIRTDEAWRALIKGSALQRAGLKRIRRSLAYAARTLPAADRAAALDALAAHPTGQDEIVQDAIAWSRRA